jgi:hypothetical protein
VESCDCIVGTACLLAVVTARRKNEAQRMKNLL